MIGHHRVRVHHRWYWRWRRRSNLRIWKGGTGEDGPCQSILAAPQSLLSLLALRITRKNISLSLFNITLCIAACSLPLLHAYVYTHYVHTNYISQLETIHICLCDLIKDIYLFIYHAYTFLISYAKDTTHVKVPKNIKRIMLFIYVVGQNLYPLFP